MSGIRFGIICTGFLLSSALAQSPVIVRVEEDTAAPPVGQCLSGDNAWSLDRQGDTYTLHVRAMRPVKAVSVFALRSFTAGHYYEHLGMRVDLNHPKLPAGWASRPDLFPGPLQGPFALGHEANRSTLLAALDWPVRVAIAAGSISLRWEGPLSAGQSHAVRFLVLEDSGPGGERLRKERLVLRYAAIVELAPQSPAFMRDWHGVWAWQGQNDPAPAKTMPRIRALGHHHFPAAILWGPAADVGGSCCDPSPALHERYGNLFAVAQSLGLPLWAYARPDPKGDAKPDAAFWANWTDGYRSKNVRTYGDTLGYRDTRGLIIPADCITEAWSILHPHNPALVSNCLTGGGFPAPGGGGLPKTLPDRTAHPLNPEPWVTADPSVGALFNGYFLWGPQNYDGYFEDGVYWTVVSGQRREWVNVGTRQAFVFNFRLCPSAMSAVVREVVDLRNMLGWDGGWRYAGTDGLDASPPGAWASVLTHTDGRRVLAIDSTDVAAGATWGLVYKGQPIARPVKNLAYVDVN